MKPLLSKLGLDLFYPIGSIYISSDKINPGLILGGVWKNCNNSEYEFG